MFATQLLRILETLPANVNQNQPSGFDATEVKVKMKENSNGYNEAEIIVSPMKENESGFLYHLSDSKDTDKMRNTLELECSMIMNDLSKHNKESPFISSELFQEDAHLYTDKNVTESEVSDSIVADKETIYHVVKDICVDEGMRADAPNEIANDVPEDESIVTKMLPLQNFGTRSFLRSFMASLNDYQDEVPQQSPEPDVGSTPITKTIDQSMTSNDDDGNTENGRDSTNKSSNNPFMVSEFHSTIPDGSTGEYTHQETSVDHNKGNTGNPFAVDEVAQMVENLSIDESSENNVHQSRFNPFALSEVESANMDDEETESIHRPSISNPENGKSINPFDAFEVQQPMMNHEKGRITNPFVDVQSSSIDGDTEKNDDQQHELNRNIGNTSNPFVEVHETTPGENAEPRDESSNHDQGECVDGETSFSAAGPVSGRITFSGAITYSGSISVRSDSSTTSTRSFAFPVLQPEWNSSPVRMRKAEGRKYRKQRGWKQGILCCKF